MDIIIINDLSTFSDDDISIALNYYEVSSVKELAEFIYNLTDHSTAVRSGNMDSVDIVGNNPLLLMQIAKQSNDPDLFENLKESSATFREYAKNPLVEKDFYNSLHIERITLPGGITEARINGKLWSINDEPAVIKEDRYKEWYKNDELHRDDDKPAIEWMVPRNNGSKYWFKHGLRHRDNDKPAVESANGTKEWWVNGQRHRENGFPAVEYASGKKEWWVNGIRIK